MQESPNARGAGGRLPAAVVASLAATWIIWGSTYLAIRFALVSLPPFLQMGSRFLTAGGLLMAWMIVVRRARWPSRVQWRNATIVGTLMLGGGMGGTAFAEQTIGSGLVVAFIAIVPVMIVAFGILWRVHPSGRELAGIAIGLAGVLMLVQGNGFQSSPAGLAALVIACITWSLGSVLSQHALPLAPGATGFASEMLCGGLVLLAMSWIAGEWPTLAAQWPPTTGAVLAWVYLVVFGSLIAFNAYMYLLATVPAGLAASYTFVNPLIGLALGVTWGAEVVSGYEWVAAGVVLTGVVVLLTARRR
ncbi:MAG: EamA family transporter [Burkholderiaceae bacterium]|nr:EamA family transporter [Burkholderiaceae bacterium]